MTTADEILEVIQEMTTASKVDPSFLTEAEEQSWLFFRDSPDERRAFMYGASFQHQRDVDRFKENS